jgi:hypothetical protein
VRSTQPSCVTCLLGSLGLRVVPARAVLRRPDRRARLVLRVLARRPRRSASGLMPTAMRCRAEDGSRPASWRLTRAGGALLLLRLSRSRSPRSWRRRRSVAPARRLLLPDRIGIQGRGPGCGSGPFCRSAPAVPHDAHCRTDWSEACMEPLAGPMSCLDGVVGAFRSEIRSCSCLRTDCSCRRRGQAVRIRAGEWRIGRDPRVAVVRPPRGVAPR